jgi:hypothetical protein
MKCVGHVACKRETRNAHNILVGKPEGKSHSEDLGVDGKIIIRTDLRKTGREVDWIHLAQNRGQ